MKPRLIILAIAACFTAAVCSCSDFLEEKSNPNYLTPDSFWHSEADINKGLTAAYAALQPARYWAATVDRFLVVDNMRSDEVDYRPDVAEWIQIATFTNDLTNYVTDYEWDNLYAGINYCNQCISNIPEIEGLDGQVLKRSVAEARFLRAYYYFRLLRNFGERIPLFTKQMEGKEEEYFPPQSEPGVIKQFIESELTQVQEDLPEKWDAPDAGRATRYAAQGILSQYYMFTGQLAKAKVELWKIISSGRFSLLDNYFHLFDGLHKNSRESIFEIQFCGNREGGKREHNQLAEHLSPGDLDGGYEEAYPSKWLFETLKQDLTEEGSYSPRLYSTILFNDPGTRYFLLPEGAEWTDYLPEDAIYWHKFDTWDPSLSSEWYYSAFNIPIVRYADILLLYAECLNDEGKTDEAISYINQVRARAHVVPLETGKSKEEVLKHLQDVERPCELSFEGTRWYDLIRWGIVEESLRNHGKPQMENFIQSKHTLFPIPHREFLLNPDWVQNPNFAK
ncbi:MAG: RagB/SusD family nutrient uptake outer membrane protein [Bacteroidales bacterium]|nr:RagB/SusD family nutrient uptake outer membrane protein [Bacteroidales bacterium]